MNISQLRDTINAAERAVWYFRRSQDFYGLRHAHDVLSKVQGMLSGLKSAIKSNDIAALTNATTLIRAALDAADIVLTADYLEGALLPELMRMQSEVVAEEGMPVPERILFEQNCIALFREETGKDLAVQVFGEALARELFEEVTANRQVTDAQWEEVLSRAQTIRENGYVAEFTGSGDVTLCVNGQYLHSNNTPAIEGLTWASRMNATSYAVYGAGLFYHIRGLQELYPGVQIDLYETDPNVLFAAMLFAPVAKVLSDGNIKLFLTEETDEVLRELFMREDEDATAVIKRIHAPSVTIMTNIKTSEAMLRFGDRTGIRDGSSPKLVSIVIPCYNAEEVIDRCLLSVVKQTIGLDQMEVICVDDASGDKTVEKLEEWQRRYPVSFKIIRHEKNGRQGKTRNTGIEHATAPYLMILDNDDWIDPDMLEEMVRIADETGVEVVAASHGIDNGDGTLLGVERYDGILEKPVYVRTEEDRKTLVKHGLHSNVWGKLYRREIFYKYDLFFPEGVVYEDNYFGPLLRYCVESYYVIDRAYYHWYNNPASAGIQKNETHHFDRLKVEELKLEELKKRGMLQAFAEDIMADFMQKYYLNSLHIFFVRFDEPPYEQIEEACAGVRKYYPDIRSNAWYKNLTDTHRLLVDLAFENTSRARWKEVFDEYNRAVKEMIEE